MGSFKHVEAAGRSPDKVVVYMRACPGPQADHSIEMQRKSCLKWIEEEKKVLVAEQVDLISGGTNPDERSGFLRALEDIEKFQAGVLLVHQVDRLSRHTTEALQLLLQARDNFGLVVIAVIAPEPEFLQSLTHDDESQRLQDLAKKIGDTPSQETPVEPSLRIWTYDTEDGDFFIASSAEEAATMFKDWMGSTMVDAFGEDMPFEAWPEDRIFRYSGEDGDGPHEHELPAYFVKKYPKGYFASVNF